MSREKYVTLKIGPQFSRESLQNEAAIPPRNSNIWASNYTSRLVFPRALASDSPNPTFPELWYSSYLMRYYTIQYSIIHPKKRWNSTLVRSPSFGENFPTQNTKRPYIAKWCIFAIIQSLGSRPFDGNLEQKERKEMNVLSCRTLPHLFPFFARAPTIVTWREF